MKKKIALLLALCVLVSVAATAFVTYALLKDDETVVNTFTVGKVGISLTEDGAQIRDDGTLGIDYHLLPGNAYDKAPVITVDSDSEDAYLVAKVTVSGAADSKLVNGDFLEISGVILGGEYGAFSGTQVAAMDGITAPYIFVSDDLILTQEKSGDDFIFTYYFRNAKSAGDSVTLFEQISIDSEWTNEELAALDDLKIVVTAYAVQTQGDGLTDVVAAYNAAF